MLRFIKSLLVKTVYKFIDFVIPTKKGQVLFYSNAKIEENALVLANYVASNYNFNVIFMCPDELIKDAKRFTINSIKVLPNVSLRIRHIKSITSLFSSKHIFFTHAFDYKLNKSHYTINIWHGVGHKKIQAARNPKRTFVTDLTIATSELTQKMFAEFFGVSEKSILKAGQPRNDLMISSCKTKNEIKKNKLKELRNFSKIIIWMPTFRRPKGSRSEVLKDIDNIYNITNFDTNNFNDILKESNAICLIKSHYFITKNTTDSSHSNIIMIDDQWLYKRNMLLYELLACTDSLITDYSSVMIDYTLIDNPIFCIAEDLEDFKESQGLYFDDYENWVPTVLHRHQNTFLESFDKFLKTNEDPQKMKRRDIRNKYFLDSDDNASQRICEKVFKI